MKKRLSLLAIIAAPFLLWNCAAFAHSPPSNQPATTIAVDNQAFLDMTVYVMRGSERLRLGLAPGGTTTTFVIPADIVQVSQPLRFIADPIGSTRTSVSEEIQVTPGDQVKMLIPPG